MGSDVCYFFLKLPVIRVHRGHWGRQVGGLGCGMLLGSARPSGYCPHHTDTKRPWAPRREAVVSGNRADGMSEDGEATHWAPGGHPGGLSLLPWALPAGTA